MSDDLLDDLLGDYPEPAPKKPKNLSKEDKAKRAVEHEAATRRMASKLVAEPRGARRPGAKTVIDDPSVLRSIVRMDRAAQEYEETLEGAAPGDSLPRFEAFWKPVGTSFLANVFKLSNSKVVREKLAECPPIDVDKHGNPLYDFVEAAAHLVPPRGKMFVQRLRTMKPSELPPQLALAVQKAKNEELTYKQRAGELWRTEAVLEVLGEVFLMMKNTMQLWVETLNDKGNLTKDQYEALSEMVYGLQTEMHDKLVQFSQQRATYAVVSEEDIYESIADE